MKNLLLVLAACLFGVSAQSQTPDPARVVFDAALGVYRSAQTQQAGQQAVTFSKVKDLLDIIVTQYPTSDLKRRILNQETIDGMDIAALTAMQTPGDDGLFEPMMPAAPPDIASDRSEKEMIRELQIELNRIGCNAGTPDGVAGRKTQRAFRHFLNNGNISVLAKEQMITEAALAALKAETRPLCSAKWLLANAPDKLAGSWSGRTECQLLFRKLRVTSTLTLSADGDGTYSGPISNSLGQHGFNTTRTDGKVVYSSSIFQGQRVSGTVYPSSKSLTFSGKDSNDCSVVMWKN